MIWEHVRETAQRSGAVAQTRTRRQLSPTHARARSFVAEPPGACHRKASVVTIVLLLAVCSARPWRWRVIHHLVVPCFKCQTQLIHQLSIWQHLRGAFFSDGYVEWITWLLLAHTHGRGLASPSLTPLAEQRLASLRPVAALHSGARCIRMTQLICFSACTSPECLR